MRRMSAPHGRDVPAELRICFVQPGEAIENPNWHADLLRNHEMKPCTNGICPHQWRYARDLLLGEKRGETCMTGAMAPVSSQSLQCPHQYIVITGD